MNRKRHESIVDIWSVTHVVWGVLFAFILPPALALALLAAWEPLENFVLSPLLWNHFNINFGHESLSNALGDIFFDGIGIIVGIFILQIL